MLLAFFRKSPFFRLFLFYAAGLTFAYFFSISLKTILVMVACGVLVFVLCITYYKRFREINLNWIYGLSASFLLLTLGSFHCGLERFRQNQVQYIASKEYVFTAKVLSQPEIKNKSVQIMVNAIGIMEGHRFKSDDFKVVLYFERDSAAEGLMPGSSICIKAWLNRIAAPVNPGEFDFRKYMANRKVYLQAYVPKGNWLLLSEDSVKNIKVIAERLRFRLLSFFGKLQMNKTEFGILSALTLGYKKDLDSQIKSCFEKAGVMHIMALSGFHVGLIAWLLSFVFRLFNGSLAGRAVKVVVVVSLLWAFAVLTGLSASVIRATVMMSFFMLGALTGRKVNVYNILFVSAFIMLAVTPGLIADVSFQLSFIAVAGIVFFYPLGSRIIKIKNPLLTKIWQIFIVSCSAQLATFPVTLYYFHQFPVFFWIANVFVVPLAVLIIYLAVGYLVFSFITPLAGIIGKMVAWAAKSLVFAVGLIEKIPNALIDGIHISVMQSVLLLLAVFCLGIYASSHNKKLLYGVVLAVLSFSVIDVSGDYKASRQKSLTINNLRGVSAVNLIAGRHNLLLVDPDSLISPEQVDYIFGNYWIERGVFHKSVIKDVKDSVLAGSNPLDFPGLYIRQSILGGQVVIDFFGETLVWLNNNDYIQTIIQQKFKTDVIFVTRQVTPDVKSLCQRFDFTCLVIDSTVSYYTAKKWMDACRKHHVSYWYISEQGAYMLEQSN